MSIHELTPEIASQICRTAGIRMAASTPTQLAEWISQRCNALALPNAQAYAQWLADLTHLQQDREGLCNLLTSRETYFLRDHGVIDVLREDILKETIAHKSADRSLKLWSVGCSTGEEAYTLSILVEETLADLKQWNVEILGSDIDQQALAQAHKAVYRAWSFRGCTPAFIARYFRSNGADLQLLDPVKQRVRFEQLDIVGDPYPDANKGMANADIILCRNVFIYLDDAAIQTALTKLVACLNEGGFLLCAPGELHAHAHPHLKARIFAQALVYQKDSTVPHAAWATPTPLAAAIPTPVRPSIAAAVKPTAQAEFVISLSKAWTLANRGEVAAATEMCDTLIRHQPLDADVRYLYAVLLLASGLTHKARETLRHVLYLDPQFAVAYAMLMDVEMCEHDTDAALKACKQGLKALSTQPDNQPVPYFKATTFQEFRLHLQQQIDSLNQERRIHDR
jgi:chemotaxis protein methyltransferase CheR